MADIDRRYVLNIMYAGVHLLIFKCSIAIVPTFTGLRRFHEGRNFKQWTGDDSKALMKVRISSY